MLSSRISQNTEIMKKIEKEKKGKSLGGSSLIGAGVSFSECGLSPELMCQNQRLGLSIGSSRSPMYAQRCRRSGSTSRSVSDVLPPLFRAISGREESASSCHHDAWLCSWARCRCNPAEERQEYWIARATPPDGWHPARRGVSAAQVEQMG